MESACFSAYPVPRFGDMKPAPPPTLAQRPNSPEARRHDFANAVIRRLVDSNVRIAVIAEHGRPAMVSTNERMYDVLSKDHAIVGVYKTGARVRDVMDDLRAAGL